MYFVWVFPPQRLNLHVLPREVDWFSLISVLGLLCFAPFIVFYFVMACDQHQCSLSQPLLHGETTLLSIWERTASFSWSAAKIYAVWVTFQVKLGVTAWGGGVSVNNRKFQLICSCRRSCICVFLTSLIKWFPGMLAVCRMEHELLPVIKTWLKILFKSHWTRKDKKKSIVFPLLLSLQA